MQYFVVCCSVLQCLAVCCSVSQWVAVCYNILQCNAVCGSCDVNTDIIRFVECVAVRYIVLLCVAV